MDSQHGNRPKPDRDPKSLLFVPEAVRRMRAANLRDQEEAARAEQREREQRGLREQRPT
jgi:hypothetical protein